MKKIIVVLSIMLLLSGCANKEKGVLEPLSVASPLVISDASGEKIVDMDAGSKIETDVFYDYYAGFSIPYPKDWILTQHSANFITISGPDAQITISHNSH